MKASSRVIFNTGVQYARTFIGACIALYSSRIILKSLGASDYGIYNLVAGVVTFIGFINLALSSTTQRYLSFYHGKNNEKLQAKIFTNSVIIQFVVGLVLALTMFSLTPLIFHKLLNIPTDRMAAAIAVYYSMIAVVFFSLITVPYTATLIAHENILFSSIVQIVESILKLIVALSLLFILKDRLIYYGIMMAAIIVIDFFAYTIYCRKHYKECRHISLKLFDKKLLKEIFYFSGWMIYSAVCIVGRTQGIAVIFNRFFGTLINAAYGIAQQLSGQAAFVSSSLLNAIRPQIIKAEGGLNRERMLRLAEIASKFSFLLLAMVVIPAVFEMKTILSIWLAEVPAHAIVFSQIMLLSILMDQLTVGLAFANQAIGNVKKYSFAINTIKLAAFPLAYLSLKFNGSPTSAMMCLLLVETLSSILRLFFLRNVEGLQISSFVKKVFLLEIFPVASIVATSWFCHNVFPYYLFWISFLVSIIVLCSATYYTGLCDDEKVIINEVLLKIKRRFAKTR
ncbi:oligosaccharide flippase family protein [Pinibacter aurantiacus]|uniref:Oligosaccharide flippase family protein n=1 Tax=Pinibacter aurantiacus TaxID=2851599 RepID=A0A9E2S791_9BACT|nr:oligosaccharide flippase family protein [Pinibacter aurantiacus]MBV4356907.1 oligosaccharide flippase family protein [Pinibacter aurantiacus]